MRPSKPWYYSKTLWLNLVAAGLVALEAQLGMVREYLDVNLYTAIAVLLPIANAMLRVVTYEAIEHPINPREYY